eukprot:GHVS01011522.1.p1 GENE.GHVS01011522.1~~GHVS01011522.1.p1  ORF type:complete len:338 (-),score=47.38 GHVS01011522.1:226-1239(-)
MSGVTTRRVIKSNDDKYPSVDSSSSSPICSSVFCPRRQHFLSPYPITGNGPVVVFPPRHCISRDNRCSVDVESYSESLKDFADIVFSIPTASVWEPINLTQDLFNKVTMSEQVSLSNVSAWNYPQHLLEGADGLPFYRCEWDWTETSQEEAFVQMRRHYFNPTYVDDESDYQLIDKLPKFKHSCLESPTTFRAVWRPPLIFTTRDWVEYICVDPSSYTVLSRSCIHPDFSEPPPLRQLSRLFALFVPSVGILRAQSCFCVRFNKPKPNNTGTTVELIFWYKMHGLPDLLCKHSSVIEKEYIRATIRMFNQMSWMNRKMKDDEKSLEIPPFDLNGENI